MYHPMLQKITRQSVPPYKPLSEDERKKIVRRRALSLVCWPYALSLLFFALLCFFFFGTYSDLTLAILYTGMMACVISLSAHVLTYGWLHPATPSFDNVCREMNSVMPLSHEQYQCIRQAAALDPQIAKHLFELQTQGWAWDNKLADRCRYINAAHT